MADLFDLFRAAALDLAPPGLVTAVEAQAEALHPYGPDRQGIEVQADLTKFGLVASAGGRPSAGPLLRAAVTLSGDLDDLSLALRPVHFETLHEDILRHAIIVHPARDINLLHARRMTEHYFEGDKFILSLSSGRDIAFDVIEASVRLLKPDFLGCLISPEGLVGAYPLCVLFSRAVGLPLCAVIRGRQGKLGYVGDVRPPPGRGLILQDVITTGESVKILDEVFKENSSITMGAITLYDRREGGREFLAERGIGILSLTSRYSLRRYCETVVRAHEPADLASVAQIFLEASLRLRLTRRRGHQAPLGSVKIAVAARAAPPVESFDDKCQLTAARRVKLRNNAYHAIAAAVEAGCSLVLFPEMSLPLGIDDALCELTRDRNLVIVGGLEYDDATRNTAVVAFEGRVTRQVKLVASPYDLPEIRLGDTINIFENTCIGSFSVLICADQIDQSAIQSLKGQIDFLIVVARNPAINTFASIAAGDAYRLEACVIMANDRACGNSLIASPQKGEQKIRWLCPTDDSDWVFSEFPLGDMRARGSRFLRKIPYRSERPEEIS